MMKRFIINIICFFSIIIVIDFFVGRIGDYLQTHSKGNETKRINDLINNDNHDVIILGSSRAHHHYDTPYLSDTLNIDVYNAGYDGFGVVMASGLLELILERYSPKLVLFDVACGFDIYKNMEDDNNKRYISKLKPYYKHEAVGHLIKDISNEEWYKVHSGLLRYNSLLITLFLDFLGEREYLHKGYSPKGGVLKDSFLTEEESIKIDEKYTSVDSIKIKYVKKLISLAKNNDVPIVFVKSPRFGVRNSDVLQPIKDICASYNVPFYDYRSSNQFQMPNYFYDKSHLNSIGAREFSKVVANEILLPILK